MKQNINWGIIGLGKIALKFGEAFKDTKNAKLLGISSTSYSKILEFNEKLKIEKIRSFVRYEDLLECKDIDIVYIALPNSHHHEWILRCIEKEKNILVEKPATVNISEIKDIKLRLNNSFFAEGFMYAYNPQIIKVIELINQGLIGDPVSMESCFGKDILTKKNIFGFKQKKKIDKKNRIYNKELGGGAILDLGCYPVSFSSLIASMFSKINYEKVLVKNKKIEIGETGVDLNSSAELQYDNNFRSKISASFTKNLGKKSVIYGTLGKMTIEDTWHAEPAIINIKGKYNERFHINSNNNIFSHEIESISKSILEGKKKPFFPGFSIDETLGNMTIISNWLN